MYSICIQKQFLAKLFLWNHSPEIIHVSLLTKSLFNWKQVICDVSLNWSVVITVPLDTFICLLARYASIDNWYAVKFNISIYCIRKSTEVQRLYSHLVFSY